jgi:antitoxin VapB
MAIHIRDKDTERLVRELAARTGRSLTGAVRAAVAEKLEATPTPEAPARGEIDLTALKALQDEAARHPMLDARPLKVIRDELWGQTDA